MGGNHLARQWFRQPRDLIGMLPVKKKFDPLAS